MNEDDDCPFIYNPDQNGKSLAWSLKLEVGINTSIYLGCLLDSDNDGVLDIDDICPDNPLINYPDFSGYETVLLDPHGSAQLDPYWVVLNQERDYTIHADRYIPSKIRKIFNFETRRVYSVLDNV